MLQHIPVEHRKKFPLYLHRVKNKTFACLVSILGILNIFLSPNLLIYEPRLPDSPDRRPRNGFNMVSLWGDLLKIFWNCRATPTDKTQQYTRIHGKFSGKYFFWDIYIIRQFKCVFVVLENVMTPRNCT